MRVPRWFGRKPQPSSEMVARPAQRFTVDIPPELLQVITGGGDIAPRISREQALQVPAVLRARNLICGALGSLPIRVHGPKREVISDVQYLVNTPPDPEVPQSVLMAATIEDLMFESVSWWRVLKFGWHGYPVQARHVPPSSVYVASVGSTLPSQQRVVPDLPIPLDGRVYIDGYPVPDNELIQFYSPNPPLLTHGARAIRTCLLLDQMAALYATTPIPLGYFAPRDPLADPASDEEIQKVLDDWEDARRSRAWGYVNAALEAHTVQWNPEQLQLAAARQHAVLEIARATGVDAKDLQAPITANQTYSNSEQKRQDLIDFTLGPYVSAIQDRLSMGDVLPRGYVARVDFAGFLRGDTKSRMDTYKVGLDVGAYTEDEVRELEDRPPLTPAQKAARKPAAPPPTPDMPAEPASQPAEETA